MCVDKICVYMLFLVFRYFLPWVHCWKERYRITFFLSIKVALIFEKKLYFNDTEKFKSKYVHNLQATVVHIFTTHNNPKKSLCCRLNYFLSSES